MKRQLNLLVSVTRDESIHRILESNILSHKNVASMFKRKYVKNRLEMIQGIENADVLFSFAVPEEAIANAKNLKWIHFASAGVDKSLNESLRRKRIKLSCSRGIHANTIAEHVIMQILAFSKNLKKSFEYQQKKEWRFDELVEGRFDLENKTIAIIGLGSIGRRIAQLASAFDMNVTGTVNNVRPIKHVDKVYSRKELHKCLSDADFVVLSTPLTDETRNIISAREFKAMKKNAFLVNIGRGSLINENDLVQALTSHKIAGAALDVFEREPLPPQSPLWSFDNVFITPHYSGMAEKLWEKVANLFCENAIRFRDGKRLIGRVSIEKGY